MTMHNYAFEYLSSWWGLTVLVITSIGFSLKTYDVFAKLWPATSGKHVTRGRITWSEFVSPELVLLKQALTHTPAQGLISYSYRVQGAQHNGTIPTDKLTQAEVDKYLYKGAEVDVYYSPRLPDYSYARKPPYQSKIAGEIAAKWLVAPVAILNAVSFYIWFLANA
jgi:hypothetical protein